MRLCVTVTQDGEIICGQTAPIDTDAEGRLLENDVLVQVPDTGIEIHIEVVA